MAHVPPPPQAEGKNILFSPSVESIVLPASTSISFLPFTIILTFPPGESLAFAKSRTPTSANTTARNTNNVVISVSIFLYFQNYN